MSNLFRAVGLPIDTARDYAAFMSVLPQISHEVPVSDGIYQHAGPDQGVEFWGHLSRDRQGLGGFPHFVGCGRMRLEVLVHHGEPDDPLQGTVTGTTVPLDEDDPAVPLALMVPDYGVIREALDTVKPADGESAKDRRIEATVQIAAYARSLECFDDVDCFHAAGRDYRRLVEGAVLPQKILDLLANLTSREFIPTGMFMLDEVAESGPQPQAIFSGEIESVEWRDNSFGKHAGDGEGRFLWCCVRTVNGWVDVVAAPDVVNGHPVVGGILVGQFDLTAQFLPTLRADNYGIACPPRPGLDHRDMVLKTPDGVEDLSASAQLNLPAGGRCAIIATLVLSIVSLVVFFIAPVSAMMSAWLLGRHWRVLTAFSRILMIIAFVVSLFGTTVTVAVVIAVIRALLAP